MLNKNVAILLFSCFCVLSINMKGETKKAFENTNIAENSVVVDVTYARPKAIGTKDASITIKILKGKGPFKIIAVSNTSLGTFTKEGDNTIVLDQLYAGFYKLYITDSEKNTIEYQVTID